MIYADFNRLHEDGPDLILLDTYGSKRDLSKYDVLSHFLFAKELTFYMDDGDDDGNFDALIVTGQLYCFDQKNNYWVAKVNWDTLRHQSDELKENNAKYL